jgi:hypothetical protein
MRALGSKLQNTSVDYSSHRLSHSLAEPRWRNLLHLSGHVQHDTKEDRNIVDNMLSDPAVTTYSVSFSQSIWA